MERLTHDQYYLQMLDLVAARSTCARRAVGAIIVDERYRVLSMGYNGVPTGLPHCIDTPCPGANDAPGDTKLCEAVHAEQNAIIQCSRLDLATRMYCSTSPCFSCAKLIANTDIEQIIVRELYADQEGRRLLSRAHIEVIVVSR